MNAENDVKRPPRITVGEVIRQLQAFPADRPVVVNGYEYGFEYPWPAHEIRLEASDDDSGYGGNFNKAEPGDFLAVVIPRVT